MTRLQLPVLAPHITPLGDMGVVVQVGTAIDERTHQRVRHLTEQLELAPLPGMIEFVPAFTTVTVYYDPLKVLQAYPVEACSAAAEPALAAQQDSARSPYAIMKRLLQELIERLPEGVAPAERSVQIPVLYGGEYGPDLEAVAQHNGLTPDEVIAIHTASAYRVYMLGFAPGFAYLGGMSPRIATPRRSTPRLAIPAGTVGIAGEQTGVYPIETPGGWQLIGKSPMALFLPAQLPPSRLQAGDVVRFYPINRREFETWEDEAQ